MLSNYKAPKWLTSHVLEKAIVVIVSCLSSTLTLVTKNGMIGTLKDVNTKIPTSTFMWSVNKYLSTFLIMLITNMERRSNFAYINNVCSRILVKQSIYKIEIELVNFFLLLLPLILIVFKINNIDYIKIYNFGIDFENLSSNIHLIKKFDQILKKCSLDRLVLGTSTHNFVQIKYISDATSNF